MVQNEQMNKLEKFLLESKAKHGDRYDYTLVIEDVMENGHLMRYSDKVRIICPEHGEFHQVTYYHRTGSHCPDCGNKNRGSSNAKAESFFKAIKSIHPTLDFSKFVYSDNKGKSVVICPLHGEFLARPNDLLGSLNRKPTECRQCALIKRGGYYNHTTVLKMQHEEQQSDCKFYFLKFTSVDTDLVFYKVGITTQKRWQRRFSKSIYQLYDIEPIYIVENTLLRCTEIEAKCLKQLALYSVSDYLPVDFAGRFECFQFNEEVNESVKVLLGDMSD